MTMVTNYLPLLLSLLGVSLSASAAATDASLEQRLNGALSAHGAATTASGRELARRAGVDLEPCINGEVSASGTFPSQAMEDQIGAYLDWSARTGRPFYLFQVGGDRLTAAYPQR
jgi:hypothetical protein